MFDNINTSFFTNYNNLILYHGSQEIVRNPIIINNGKTKDFGYGFYCTNKKEQAVRWATRFSHTGTCNRYKFIEHSDLNILKFEKLSDDWLDFIANCRAGISHSYDIVEGPMADDTIFNYVQDFLAGNISRSAFWELAKFRYPTHQICFCTQRAIDSCLIFLSGDVCYGKRL